jgi:ubiquinone/menaquinone biosynthesis C-methylase UbiE
MNLLQKFLSLFRSQPDPKLIARQLRKPSGELADQIAAKMDEVNAPLYNLTLNTMQLRDKESVLEIGFGSGKFFPKLFGEASQLRVSGIDYSPEMVKKAKQNNRSTVKNDTLTIKEGNSNNIPFPSHSFDKVFCNMVIYFWDQPEEHLKEIHRVLKPNGRFYTGLRTKDSMLKLPFIEHGFNLYDKEQWSTLLKVNGFQIIQIAEKTDPEIEIENQTIKMKSVCIIAEKERVTKNSFQRNKII